MSRIKKILLAALIVFIAIQFIRPAHNESGQPSPTDISKIDSVPGNVQAILKKILLSLPQQLHQLPLVFQYSTGGMVARISYKRGKSRIEFQ